MSDPTPLAWSEIYDRLARRPDRPDPLAWASLEWRVRAWTSDEELVAETCAAVWRTLNLARGGAAFEGFVQGRFMGVLPSPPGPLSLARERGSQAVGEADPAPDDRRAERLSACLEELRARNPRHHAAIALLYEDRANVPEAADVLRVDPVTVRALAARARLALVQCLERSERRGEPRVGDRPGRNGGRPPARRQSQQQRRRGR